MSTPDLHRLPVAPRTEEYVTVAELQAAIAQMLPDFPEIQTLDATTPQPTLRIRVEHSRTIKDGWGYSTTVEMDGIDAGDRQRIDKGLELISDTLVKARKLAEFERDIRNHRDAAAKEATAHIASNAN